MDNTWYTLNVRKLYYLRTQHIYHQHTAIMFALQKGAVRIIAEVDSAEHINMIIKTGLVKPTD